MGWGPLNERGEFLGQRLGQLGADLDPVECNARRTRLLGRQHRQVVPSSSALTASMQVQPGLAYMVQVMTSLLASHPRHLYQFFPTNMLGRWLSWKMHNSKV
jgi:hypothetical protein